MMEEIEKLKSFECGGDMAAFYDDMSKLQGELVPPKKDQLVSMPLKNGGKKEYKFAALEDNYDAIKKVAPEYGFCFFQDIESFQNQIVVTTEVGHKSGAFRRTRVIAKVPTFKDFHGNERDATPQEIASSITYFRRYAISGAFGFASEADDDAESVSDKEKVAPKKPDFSPPPKKEIVNHAPQSQAEIPGKLDFKGANELKALGFSNGWSVDQMTKTIEQITGSVKWSDVENKHLPVLKGLFGKQKGGTE